MANTIQCDIVSAEESIYSGTVERIIASGLVGDLGIEPGHAALLTPLQPGPVRIVKEGGEEEIVYLSGGYLEVQPNVVTVLADTVTRAVDLDEAQATKAREDALHQMGGTTGVDYELATAQLTQALAQLRTIQQLRSKVR